MGRSLRILKVNATRRNDYDYYEWQGSKDSLLVTVDWTQSGKLSFGNYRMRTWSASNEKLILVMVVVGTSPEVEECKSTFLCFTILFKYRKNPFIFSL